MKTLLYFSKIGLLLTSEACKKKTICPANFTGNNCKFILNPTDSVIGNYHIVGYNSAWYGGTNYPPVLIDDTVAITKVDNNTLKYAVDSLYFSIPINDSDSLYVYGSIADGVTLTFHRPLTDDSAFYDSHYGTEYAGGRTHLAGIKIN